jgi:hypothetical protein
MAGKKQSARADHRTRHPEATDRRDYAYFNRNMFDEYVLASKVLNGQIYDNQVHQSSSNLWDPIRDVIFLRAPNTNTYYGYKVNTTGNSNQHNIPLSWNELAFADTHNMLTMDANEVNTWKLGIQLSANVTLTIFYLPRVSGQQLLLIQKIMQDNAYSDMATPMKAHVNRLFTLPPSYDFTVDVRLSTEYVGRRYLGTRSSYGYYTAITIGDGVIENYYTPPASQDHTLRLTYHDVGTNNKYYEVKLYSKEVIKNTAVIIISWEHVGSASYTGTLYFYQNADSNGNARKSVAYGVSDWPKIRTITLEASDTLGYATYGNIDISHPAANIRADDSRMPAVQLKDDNRLLTTKVGVYGYRPVHVYASTSLTNEDHIYDTFQNRYYRSYLPFGNADVGYRDTGIRYWQYNNIVIDNVLNMARASNRGEDMAVDNPTSAVISFNESSVSANGKGHLLEPPIKRFKYHNDLINMDNRLVYELVPTVTGHTQLYRLNQLSSLYHGLYNVKKRNDVCVTYIKFPNIFLRTSATQLSTEYHNDIKCLSFQIPVQCRQLDSSLVVNYTATEIFHAVASPTLSKTFDFEPDMLLTFHYSTLKTNDASHNTYPWSSRGLAYKKLLPFKVDVTNQINAYHIDLYMLLKVIIMMPIMLDIILM